MNCRQCQSALAALFVDRGTSTLSRAFLSAADPSPPEKYYPLRLRIGTACWLARHL
jgi:hypothetical protein